MEDITSAQDGGVLKQTIKPSNTNRKPQSHELVTIHYTATVKDAIQPFDNTRARNEVLEFKMDEGNIFCSSCIGEYDSLFSRVLIAILYFFLALFTFCSLKLTFPASFNCCALSIFSLRVNSHAFLYRVNV